MSHQPFLLLALDDYLSDPSQDCLARLFDAVNSMDLSPHTVSFRTIGSLRRQCAVSTVTAHQMPFLEALLGVSCFRSLSRSPLALFAILIQYIGRTIVFGLIHALI